MPLYHSLLEGPIQQLAASNLYVSWSGAAKICSVSLTGEPRGFVHCAHPNVKSHSPNTAFGSTDHLHAGFLLPFEVEFDPGLNP